MIHVITTKGIVFACKQIKFCHQKCAQISCSYRCEAYLHVDNFIYIFIYFTNKVEYEELCSVCRAYTGVEVHPCRVCCKVFHELCLKKKGKLYDQSELEAFRKANTETGWSCHDCVSTMVLLMYCITKIIQSNPITVITAYWPGMSVQNPGRGSGCSRFQLTRMVEWEQNSKPKKIPRASNKTPKNPWTKI